MTAPLMNPLLDCRERLNLVFEQLAAVNAGDAAVAMALGVSLRKARREMASARHRIEARQEAVARPAGCAPVLSFLTRPNNCRMPVSVLMERADERHQPILRTFDRAAGRSTSVCASF